MKINIDDNPCEDSLLFKCIYCLAEKIEDLPKEDLNVHPVLKTKIMNSLNVLFLALPKDVNCLKPWFHSNQNN